MNPVPIPEYSQFFLPAWPWLLMALSTFTFWLHLLLVGTVLGCTIFVLLRRFRFRKPIDLDKQLDGRIIKTIPVFLSLTITLGVAPLLFIQALYGHYFYTANILIAKFWLSSLGFLMLGFIAVYLAGLYWQRKWGLLFITIVPLAFLSVLYIFTNNAVLAIQPEHWLEFQRGLRHLHVIDAENYILLPRLLHNIGATLVISGLAIAWIGRFRTGLATGLELKTQKEHAACTGLRWLLIGLGLQLIFGTWYLISIPADMLKHLAGFSTPAGIAWVVALLFVVLNFFTAVNGLLKPQETKWLIYSSLLPVFGLIGMLMARQQLRSDYLARDVAGNFDIYRDWTVQVQPLPIIVIGDCLYGNTGFEEQADVAAFCARAAGTGTSRPALFVRTGLSGFARNKTS
jgi:hypothetical protein